MSASRPAMPSDHPPPTPPPHSPDQPLTLHPELQDLNVPKVNSLYHERDRLRRDLNHVKSHYQTLQTQYDTAQETAVLEIGRLANENLQLVTESKQLKEKIDATNEQVDELKTKNSETERRLAEKRTKKRQYKENVRDLESDKTHLIGRNTTLISNSQALQDQLSAEKQCVTDRNAALHIAGLKYRNAQTSLENFKRGDYATVVRENEESEAAKKKAEGDVTDLELELGELKEAFIAAVAATDTERGAREEAERLLEEERDSLTKANKERGSLQNKVNEQEAFMNGLQSDLDGTREEIEYLQQQLSEQYTTLDSIRTELASTVIEKEQSANKLERYNTYRLAMNELEGSKDMTEKQLNDSVAANVGTLSAAETNRKVSPKPEGSTASATAGDALPSDKHPTVDDKPTSPTVLRRSRSPSLEEGECTPTPPPHTLTSQSPPPARPAREPITSAPRSAMRNPPPVSAHERQCPQHGSERAIDCFHRRSRRDGYRPARKRELEDEIDDYDEGSSATRRPRWKDPSGRHGREEQDSWALERERDQKRRRRY